MKKSAELGYNLIEDIIKNNIHLFFISPHLDDAIFSAGGLISYLSSKTSITIINVFTSYGDGRNTLSAKAYLKQCHSTNAQRLFKIRLREDKTVFSKLNLQVINLGFTDALWRKVKRSGAVKSGLGKIIPEFNNLYPTYRFHIISGKIHREDSILEDRLKDRLKAITRKNKGSYITFCPLGFGYHVDHLIVRNACEKIFVNNLVYWSDLPYLLKLKKGYNLSGDTLLTKFIFRVTAGTKKRLCKLYKSQISQIVKDRAVYEQEVYYLKNSGIIP